MIAIAAMTPSRVIGAKGGIPWHYSEDLKFFKRTTLGHVVVMGRTTYASLGRPLPGRDNWVLSRGPSLPDVRTFVSPSELPEPPPDKTLFVIGGAQIYELLLPWCSEILLTKIRKDYPGDTFFPQFEEAFAPAKILLENPDFVIQRYVRRAANS
ncbi:MAG: dihydrofolate reductase [Terrimicrobiaceae bacterium]